MKNEDDLLHKIALTLIPMVGAVNGKTLVGYSGSATQALTATKKELMSIPNIGEVIAENIIKNRDVAMVRAEKELVFIEKNNVEVIFYADKNYPARLKQYNDCPFLLFYKGTASLDHYRTVGIVGTRKVTPYGKTTCEELVDGLRKYDAHVISGLAYGVDVTAHKKSVELGIPTIGIMGNGLGRVYPSDHKQIAEKMIENGGLLTEHLHDVGPEREHFPMRNRLIAALSDALVVVETADSGGSIITAEIANTYNKDVFAIPGRTKDPFSKGCNRLIKTNKAALLESADDLGYIMRWDEIDKQQKHIQPRLFVELTPNEQIIMDLLQTQNDMAIDMITAKTGFSSSETASVLLSLEFQGLLKVLPGKRYMVF